jgi:hypothetical protein
VGTTLELGDVGVADQDQEHGYGAQERRQVGRHREAAAFAPRARQRHGVEALPPLRQSAESPAQPRGGLDVRQRVTSQVDEAVVDGGVGAAEEDGVQVADPVGRGWAGGGGVVGGRAAGMLGEHGVVGLARRRLRQRLEVYDAYRRGGQPGGLEHRPAGALDTART